MVLGDVARRPGLVLAACTWVAFAAPAIESVQRATTVPDSLSHQVSYLASTGFGNFPSFCLVVAAVLLLIEQLSSPGDGSPVPVAAAVVLVSAVVSLVVTWAGVVALPAWSKATPAWQWLAELASYATAGALAVLAALVADQARRRVRSSGEGA